MKRSYSANYGEPKYKSQSLVFDRLKVVFDDAIKERGFATVGYYIGGMKEKDLKITESKNIVVATYIMAEAALDIKTLTR